MPEREPAVEVDLTDLAAKLEERRVRGTSQRPKAEERGVPVVPQAERRSGDIIITEKAHEQARRRDGRGGKPKRAPEE
jgi:hypothetical protein